MYISMNMVRSSGGRPTRKN